MSFIWGLTRDDLTAQQSLAQIATPGTASYRHFMTPAQVNQTFGASPQAIKRVTSFIKRKKLKASVDKSRTFVRLTGTVGQFEAAFRFKIVSRISPDQTRVYHPTRVRPLPKSIRSYVAEQLWRWEIPLPAVRGAGARPRDSSPPVDEGTMKGVCGKISGMASANTMMSAAQQATAYGITGLQPRADTAGKWKGRKASRLPSAPMGIISLGAGFTTRLLKMADKCFGVPGTAYRVETAGLAQPLESDVGEGDLDTQMATAVLAGAWRVPVFEAASVEPGGILAPAAVLNFKRRPSVISISYGTCEQHQAAGFQSLADALYVRLGLVGTSTLAAAGDTGSSACSDDSNQQGLSVDYPASSPWVTGVGGTRIVLNAANQRASETVWNDTPWTGTGGNVSAGGGFSVEYSRPAWQPPEINSTEMRAVPDLSAHASSYPGFSMVYGIEGQFAGPTAGTSAATPLVAAGIALINQSLADQGQPPLGLLNPWLYQLPSGSLFDITSGTNDEYGVGCCTARTGYDEASGLGSPNFDVMRANVVAVGGS